MSLSEGCVLRRAIPKDAIIKRDDVDLPPGRLVDEIRAEQDTHFG